MFYFEVVGYGLFAALFLAGPCLAWPEFVEHETVCHTHIRRALLRALAVCTLIEAWLWLSGDLETWSFGLIFLVNCWGTLDAVLRFPVLHSFSSMFVWKQLALVMLKVMCYVCGFHDAVDRLALFVIALLGLVFTLPLLYITALPLGDTPQVHMKHDAIDQDLVMRVVSAFHDPQSHAQIRAAKDKLTVGVAKAVPLLRQRVARTCPRLAGQLRQGPSV
jgi:hypothetical protein